jgi:magnesium transporter
MNANTMSLQLGEKIRGLLVQRNKFALRRLLARHNFADISDAMENVLTAEEAVFCFQYFAPQQASNVLISLDDERQVACLASLTASKAGKILRAMPADEAVDLLQKLPSDETRKILGSMPFDADTRTLHQLLLESPDTAAGIMSTDFVTIPVEGTVGEAISLVRKAEEKDFIYYIYLVDQNEKLIGVVSLKQLVVHTDDTPLNRIATFDIKSVLLSFDQALVANLFRKYYNLLAMPVVDANDIMQGIVTLDDILDVVDEETVEDMMQASGISIEAVDERNLLSGPAYLAVKARLPWLSITMLGQLLNAGIVASFHQTVSSAVIAYSFVPLLSGLAGNMATQSDTISVRGLALSLIRGRAHLVCFLPKMGTEPAFGMQYFLFSLAFC